jgi:hypothetical protein
MEEERSSANFGPVTEKIGTLYVSRARLYWREGKAKRFRSMPITELSNLSWH